MQIKKLEEELEVKLFDRSRQPIIPTDVGKMLVEQAKIVLHETRQIDGLLQAYKGTVAGDLYMGIIPTISSSLMPYLIGNITRKYPSVQLHVRELLTDEIVSELQNDNLDVGILSTPLGIEGMEERPLFYEKFKLYLHPEHPAYGDKQIDPSRLLEDKLWLLSEGNCFRNQAVNLCALREGLNGENMFDYESGSLETLVRIVDREGGATILPEWGSVDMNEASKKNLREISGKEMVREVSMVFTRNFAKRRLMDALEEVVNLSVPAVLRENVGKEIIDIKMI
jgi:LysR family hydrogen peroxide-inducible transcriptional activator